MWSNILFKGEVVEQGTSPLPPTVIASFIASGSEATSEAIPPLPDQRGLPRPYGPRNDGWRDGPRTLLALGA